jgi:monoterpene epsilon-lactone hydrolase
MRVHLFNSTLGSMEGQVPSQYEIRVSGRLGESTLLAFPAFRVEAEGSDTVLTGILPDQSALYGVLAQMEALGLQLIEVRRQRPDHP